MEWDGQWGRGNMWTNNSGEFSEVVKKSNSQIKGAKRIPSKTKEFPLRYIIMKL